jgi:hypothetical protein
MWWFVMNDGWVQADELQDKRLDNLEQRLVLLEQTLIEVKGMLRVVKALAIGVAGVLGLNVHQIML